MPRTKTTITSERARELGRRGAAAVERDPVTKRFRSRAAPADPPLTEPPVPAPPPPADPPPTEPAPAPPFRLARSLFGRKRA